jgi:sarcosine oxidase subunit beta
VTTLEADVVVVGSGIVGASCAYHLAECGQRVVVVEARESAALGSTGKSNACVRAQWRDSTNIRLCWDSIQRYRDFESLYGTDVGYRPIGYVMLHGTQHWEAQLKAVELQQSFGVPVEVLSAEDAQRLVPFEREGVAGVTWGRADGRIDPHIATYAFLNLARERKACMVWSNPVNSIGQIGNKWHVDGPQVKVIAECVVNAAGGWSGDVARLAGLEVPVFHSRRMLFSTATGQRGDLPMTIDATSGFFIRSEGDRLIMGFGGEHEKPGYTEALDWEWLEHVMEAGMERFPWIVDLPMDQNASWAGTYDMSPDHRPVIGRMPGAPTWVNACGFSGHGVMQAPAVGLAVAEEIVDGRAHTVDIESLRLERLSSGFAAPKDLVF